MKNRKNMKENPLLYVQLSLQVQLVENTKIFLSYVKHFWIFPPERIAESWLVYVNKIWWIIQWCSLTETIKQS